MQRVLNVIPNLGKIFLPFAMGKATAEFSRSFYFVFLQKDE